MRMNMKISPNFQPYGLRINSTTLTMSAIKLIPMSYAMCPKYYNSYL
jgi:hypothetical protein